MRKLTRGIGVGLVATLLATTVMPPMASAQEWRREHREHERRGGDNVGVILGLGIAALAGAAIIGAAQPAYQPPPVVYYPPPQPYAPTTAIINGLPAYLGTDGQWYYYR